MIVIKYNGGFGNQIFQYLAGASIAKKLNTEVFFDMSFFRGRKTRKYEMGLFGIEKNEYKDPRPFLYWKTRKILKMPKSFMGLNIYNEESFGYENRFNEIKNNTFVEGFFQSPLYFDEMIAKKLEFTMPVSKETEKIAKEMTAQNSVSIHVRLGDYVQKSFYSKIFEHLDGAYYLSAIEEIKKRVGDPVFYVFSDDIKEAKKVLNLENVVYVEHNTGDNSWQDMYLMTRCKHNIIANSSFSFFGAYLNKNDQKTVIAPVKWFQDPSKTTKDVYPESWITVF